ncbi:ABC transporter ATP-binding protein [Tissierella carlieri]|uniref:ABC transporter ATP-binding protein n=1 Tax=Tissierella carlieri TaxID=689904 RepID=A0ABT1SFA4_9FIRM|nr:ABC transporter ATP-binding protein [Tissierella carlieri]MCQ4925159.1 ABC transporter ATP-binding protein [Tissierella carlieri]
MSLVEMINVSKGFKGINIFEDLNITFEKEEIYGIVGPNGSGKSVLFKIICGFIFPDSGVIKINGNEMNLKNRFPTNFGIIIDRPGYLEDKSGYENLEYLALIRKKIGKDEIKTAMERVGLDPNLKTKVKNYSLGMKQKLALCQAIMEDQDVLLLDEPFNALDKSSVENIRSLLLDLHKQNKTIFITSHNQMDIDLLCTKVYEIDNQKLKLIV